MNINTKDFIEIKKIKMMENKEINSFQKYIIKCLQSDFHEDDIKIGFTKIDKGNIKGELFYKKPTDALFVIPFKKEDIIDGFPAGQENIPDIMYFV